MDHYYCCLSIFHTSLLIWSCRAYVDGYLTVVSFIIISRLNKTQSIDSAISTDPSVRTESWFVDVYITT